MVGEVKEPLVAEWLDLPRVKPPEALLKIDVDAVNLAPVPPSVSFHAQWLLPKAF